MKYWNNHVNKYLWKFLCGKQRVGAVEKQERKQQIVKASLNMEIVIARVALALSEWAGMMLIRRIFISLGSVE